MLFDNRCDCDCHEEGRDIRHIAPCCYRCGVCKQRINAFAYSTHTKECAEKHKALLERIMKESQVTNCEHNWVMDGHNAGEPICSKCYARQ